MATKLKLAIGHYQALAPLVCREVEPSGVDLDISVINNPREIFERMHGSTEFDAGEMSISEHIYQVSAGSSPFLALPVFPTRVFTHAFFVVNRKSGINSPRDLEGKRVGVPYYQMTSAVYCRGLLENDHGVDLSRIEWIEGGMESAGGHGNPIKWPSSPPNLKSNDTGLSLNQLLSENRIDATLGPLMPSAYGTHPDLVPLFPESNEAEADYYRRTRILPINHILVCRRSVLEQHPEVAANLYEACLRSKEKALGRLRGHIRGHWPIPWLNRTLDMIDEVLGGDPWPFGIEANRATLEGVIGYMHQQQMIETAPSPEELFAPSLAGS